MKKLLITGGNGYLGKSLYEKLKNEYDVTVIVRSEIDLSDAKMTSKFFSKRFFDVVIHCAFSGGSRLKEDSEKDYLNNILMFNNLIANKKSFTKLISFGSGKELSSDELPYARSKKAIRKTILETENFFNLRIFGVFDCNEAPTRFIKSCIASIKSQRSIVVHQDRFMDFFYFEDLAKVVKFYAENEKMPKEIDCVYAKKHTLVDIATTINGLSEQSVEIFIEKEELDLSYLGNGKTLENLNLNLMGLSRGIEDTYNTIINT
jgi:GDP-L-fucose synthase